MKKYLYLILIFIISCHKPYELVSVNLNVSKVIKLENWGIQAKNLITIWCPRIARVLGVEEYHTILISPYKNLMRELPMLTVMLLLYLPTG